MKRLKKISLCLLVGIFLSFVVALRTELTASNSWNFVTIPGLPSGAGFGPGGANLLWTDSLGNAYVWAARTTPGTTDAPESFLYYWNGRSWS